MQYDHHVMAWRAYRFYRTGTMVRMLEMGENGPEWRYLDSVELYR
jgi:hypothetical protein